MTSDVQTIYKYLVPIRTAQTVMIPGPAKILCVQMQEVTPVIWALVQIGNPNQPRHLVWYPTGVTMPIRLREYIGTVQTPLGLVFHLFEEFPA